MAVMMLVLAADRREDHHHHRGRNVVVGKIIITVGELWWGASIYLSIYLSISI
jgi:hypothetical protein